MKVYRLISENKLLASRIRRNKKGKRLASDLLSEVNEPFEHMQIDIKYIYIHGLCRNALLCTALDIKSRAALAYRFNGSIIHQVIINMLQKVFLLIQDPGENDYPT